MLAALILLSFVAQAWAPEQGLSWALYPQAVEAGHYSGLLTSLFLHGGWAHVLMNAAFVLAFGAPVARLLGTHAAGAIAFYIFYLACGVLAGLAFVLLNPGGMEPAVGASGAAAGLMGATARLLERRGRLGSPFSRPVLAMAGAWIAVNLLFGLIGWAPGSGGSPIAWQAHLGGFAAGLLLIGPVHWLVNRR